MIFVGGYTQSSTGSFDDVFIVKMDSNLNFTNTSRIDLPNDEYLTKIDFEEKKTTLSGPFKIFSVTDWSYFSIDLDSNFSSCNLVNWTIDSFSSTYNQTNLIVNVDSIHLEVDTNTLFLENQNIQFSPYFCNIIISPSEDTIKDTTINIDKSKIFYNEVNVYPNPANQKIKIATQFNLISTTIYNSVGKMILNQNNSDVINVEELENGLYILISKTENKIYSTKFIKN